MKGPVRLRNDSKKEKYLKTPEITAKIIRQIVKVYTMQMFLNQVKQKNILQKLKFVMAFSFQRLVKNHGAYLWNWMLMLLLTENNCTQQSRQIHK